MYVYIYIHHEGPAKSHNATPIFSWGSSPNSDLQVALWTLQNCAVSDKNIQNARPCCAEPRWCTGYCDLAAMTVDEWMHVTSRIVVSCGAVQPEYLSTSQTKIVRRDDTSGCE